MKLEYLLHRAEELSARTDVLGWLSLAKEYLALSPHMRLDDFLHAHFGVEAPAPTPRTRLDHVGLKFIVKGSSPPPLQEAAEQAGLVGTSLFPSVVLAQTLGQNPAFQGVQVEIFKARVSHDASAQKVEVLLLRCPEHTTKMADLRRLAEPLLHVAFAADSAPVHAASCRQLERFGLVTPVGGAAHNPHEGLFSSYYDGTVAAGAVRAGSGHDGSGYDSRVAGKPLRLEVCYSLAAASDHD